jgi:hypothetical protein
MIENMNSNDELITTIDAQRNYNCYTNKLGLG